jgi:hypothetical protein
LILAFIRDAAWFEKSELINMDWFDTGQALARLPELLGKGERE